MPTYLIPSDSELIEHIAKSICRDRTISESINIISGIEELDGILDDVDIDVKFNSEFERLWSSQAPFDLMVRHSYMEDAINAINSINVYLLSVAK